MKKQLVTTLGLLFALSTNFTAGLAQPAQAASTFTKVDTMTRGAVGQVALEQCVNKVYTPVQDSDNNLRMVGWGMAGGALSELPETGDDFVAGGIKRLATTNLNGCNFLVTAVRGADNGMKLISWFSGVDGFERLGDTNTLGAVTEVAMTNIGLPNNNAPSVGRVVTAARATGNKLLVSVFDVNANGAITMRDAEFAGEVSEVTIVPVAPAVPSADYYMRVVTAVRTQAGNLKLISWGIKNNGTVDRLSDSGDQAGAASQIALARYDTRRVVTAIKNGEGNLQMTAWNLESFFEIERIGDESSDMNNNQAGAVSEIAMTAYTGSSPFKSVATAVRTASGNLRVIGWGIDPDGNFLRRGDSGDQAGQASQIEIGWSQESDRIVTAMRDGDNNLRVITWNVN